MDKNQIEALEAAMLEEHRRDMDALNRLKRFIPNGAPPAPPPIRPVATQTESDDDDNETEGAVATLRSKVGETMAADPSRGWTGQKMLAHLQKMNFPFKAQKPLNSIVVAMSQWVKRGYATVTRRGRGRLPNVIKWIHGKPFPLEVNVSESLHMKDSA